MAKFEKLVDPNVVVVATALHDGYLLRAVARQWPGGAPDVYLEYIAFGDEAEPFVVKRQTKVEGFSASSVDALTWEEDRVVITTDSDFKPRQYVVRASAETFETKAVRR